MRFPLQSLFWLIGAIAFFLASMQRGYTVFGSIGVPLFGASAIMCIAVLCVTIVRWSKSRIRGRIACLALFLLPLASIVYPRLLASNYDDMREVAEFEHSLSEFESSLRRDERFAGIDMSYFGSTPVWDGCVFVDGTVSTADDLDALQTEVETARLHWMMIWRVTVDAT